jgi:DNA-binding response OmpR family regulator
MLNKILVIDDEPDFLSTIKDFLTQRGYSVVTARNGEEGLEVLGAESPALILLDLKMPKKDGYEFLKHIRDSKGWIPVIIISALTNPKDIFKGYEFEADYYLTKPVNLEGLLKAIQIMLSLIPLRKK